MLIQDFKYFVNAFMLENLIYFINLKNCINCYKCQQGCRQDPPILVIRYHTDFMRERTRYIILIKLFLTSLMFSRWISTLKTCSQQPFETSLPRLGNFNHQYNIQH